MKRGLLVTVDIVVAVRFYEEPLYKTIGADVGGWIEIVRPQGLPRPYVMVVNEEGLYKCPRMNHYGSKLYGGYIMGDIVLMKEGYNDEGEMDLLGITDEDVNILVGILEKLH